MWPKKVDNHPEESMVDICQNNRINLFQGYKINTLYETASHVIATVLPLGTWTGIVSFETDAEIRSSLVQIMSKTTRDFLISKLPNTTTGSTCISCGLYKAFEVRILFRKYLCLQTIAYKI